MSGQPEQRLIGAPRVLPRATHTHPTVTGLGRRLAPLSRDGAALVGGGAPSRGASRRSKICSLPPPLRMGMLIPLVNACCVASERPSDEQQAPSGKDLVGLIISCPGSPGSIDHQRELGTRIGQARLDLSPIQAGGRRSILDVALTSTH